MALVAPRSWLDRRRWKPSLHRLVYADERVAVPLRPGRDPLERFVLDHLAERGPVSRTDLVATLAGWIAQRERATGGGAGDLGVWDEAWWRDEAARVIARLDGDLIGLIDPWLER